MDSDATRDRLSHLFEIDQHRLDPVSRTIEEAGGQVVERLEFRNGAGEAIRGFLTRPAGKGVFPAILYIHAHGARYDIGASELLDGRPALLGPLGLQFAHRGYVTLCIDMPAFGSRAEPGEAPRTKERLWRRKSLAGQMLGEQRAALDWLIRRDDVDADRVGAYGLSMGATLAYWLASVDERIACLAHLCCYADFDTLIETGAHDLHGIYLTIPGLLTVATNGEIAGLIAPRPQLIAVGDEDPLTPPLAVDRALAETREAYAAAGATDRLILIREPASGHVETPTIRARVFDFFRRYLAP